MSSIDLTFALLIASSVVALFVIISIICIFCKRCPLYKRLARREQLLVENQAGEADIYENDISSASARPRPVSWTPPAEPYPNEPPPRYTRRPKTPRPRPQPVSISQVPTTPAVATAIAVSSAVNQ